MKYLLSILFVLSCAISSLANLAAPSQGGATLTEPSGIKSIDIVREKLDVDFSQLSDESRAKFDRYIDVDAQYEVNCAADVPMLQLVFVVVSEARNFEFSVDNLQIPTEIIDNKEFNDRSTWKKPDTTPFENKQLMYNPNNGNLKSATFTIILTKGKHLLRAKYKALPTVYSDIGVLKGWQFAYALSPARDWKSFGGLDLTIKVPHEWRFFGNLELKRDGDVLTGKFDQIPSDFLAITVQSNYPVNYQLIENILDYFFFGALCLIPLIGLILVWFRAYKWKNSWVYGLLFGLIWALFVGAAWILSDLVPKNMIPEGQYATYGYGDLSGTFFIIILAPVTFVLGAAIWIDAGLVRGNRLIKSNDVIKESK